MNVHEPLGKSHFTQLYFQAAKIREAELAAFFSRFEQDQPRSMDEQDLEAATEAAGEIYEFLQRVQSYLSEAKHLGEASILQRQ